MTGSPRTVLVVVRGNSGSGKSSVAAALRAAYGRGLAVVGQDNLRRTVLRERDLPGAAAVGLVDTVARYALDHGFHTVVEGIMAAERYGPMLARLAAQHRGLSRLYYLDVPFAETVRRHATRPQHAEFTPAEMAGWYHERDLLPDGLEQLIGPDSTLEATVRRMLDDTALAPPGWHPRP
ncbi:AAA family ATPase [Kitasatospora brasiliensis]|uniref:AAA family ATPase n=1 Tax=Kitasatospora brasiliensis TaxID=3058040 RepID=UPI002931EC21|nr:AAA family ATPase [Kitasatospora sp. K002]